MWWGVCDLFFLPTECWISLWARKDFIPAANLVCSNATSSLSRWVFRVSSFFEPAGPSHVCLALSHSLCSTEGDSGNDHFFMDHLFKWSLRWSWGQPSHADERRPNESDALRNGSQSRGRNSRHSTNQVSFQSGQWPLEGSLGTHLLARVSLCDSLMDWALWMAVSRFAPSLEGHSGTVPVQTPIRFIKKWNEAERDEQTRSFVTKKTQTYRSRAESSVFFGFGWNIPILSKLNRIFDCAFWFVCVCVCVCVRVRIILRKNHFKIKNTLLLVDSIWSISGKIPIQNKCARFLKKVFENRNTAKVCFENFNWKQVRFSTWANPSTANWKKERSKYEPNRSKRENIRPGFAPNSRSRVLGWTRFVILMSVSIHTVCFFQFQFGSSCLEEIRLTIQSNLQNKSLQPSHKPQEHCYLTLAWLELTCLEKRWHISSCIARNIFSLNCIRSMTWKQKHDRNSIVELTLFQVRRVKSDPIVHSSFFWQKPKTKNKFKLACVEVNWECECVCVCVFSSRPVHFHEKFHFQFKHLFRKLFMRVVWGFSHQSFKRCIPSDPGFS